MDLIGLIPSFGGLIYTIGAFVIALSIIVFIHEYGHYIVGRWSGIHAEVFSLGFGPVLWSREDKHGTRWQVAALPFGGYVKFLGDANAASAPDAEAMAELTDAERRRTMPGAPLWARSATVVAGPVFNFILSIVVFAGLSMIQGVATDPLTVDEVSALPYNQGLQSGDVILAIDGKQTPSIDNFGEFLDQVPDLTPLPYTVMRDGQELVVDAPHPMPARVASVNPQSAAIDAGLEVGDVITAINGDPIRRFEELRETVVASNGAALNLEVWRDGETLQFVLNPRRVDLPKPEGGFETRWLIGISGGLFFDAASETPGIFEAIWTGADQTVYVLSNSLSGVWHMIQGAISTCNLNGPIGIAEISGDAASQGWLSFIGFIGLLSAAVGLINLFPIPVLDGGHLVFHAYEAVAGRKPGDQAMRLLMAIGGGMLLTLMIFAISNDIFCP
ncbi:MAG: RIP metalloprotease RseP [Rhodobacteraceae bacterium]|nr:RIP metalloprotease RseP [Paracoccaceae bacterium]